MHLTPWTAAGEAVLTVTGADGAAVILAGLRGVHAAAAAGTAHATSQGDSVTAMFRGQGADLAGVFAELAADLLAQLDANGPSLGQIQLDGLLTTDEGGYSAWGSASGPATSSPPPVGISLDSMPTVHDAGNSLTLRCRLRRD